MTDTALKAMKRAARAVLAEDLKAQRATITDLRKQLKDQREEHARTVMDLQRILDHQTAHLRTVMSEKDRLVARVSKALAWVHKHSAGNKAAEVCLQYVTAREGYGEVCPFARWDLPRP